ncbi:MAG: hypothetical protein [Microviridae sp.]|nr:MAG: hypothetical protein [Microviridae sp.]
MKILVGCEESQIVTLKLRNLGHEAYSCDIKETTGMYEDWHIKNDIREVMNKGWDMMIAFPPCTHIANSGNRWKKEKREQGLIEEAIKFVKHIAAAEIKMIAIENPIGELSTAWRKPDQIIHPWQFGHGEIKPTCLWLKNLPKLKPTNIVEGREEIIHKMPPSEERATLRSKTYNGIAEAMAEQWTKKQYIQLEIQ